MKVLSVCLLLFLFFFFASHSTPVKLSFQSSRRRYVPFWTRVTFPIAGWRLGIASVSDKALREGEGGGGEEEEGSVL